MVDKLLISMRPEQWVKNVFLFAGALFGRHAGAAVSLTDVLYVGLAFFYFCLLSGAVYLVNDVLDRERDRRHPLKCKRPIASGQVSPAAALGAALLALAGAAVLAWLISYRPPPAEARQYFWMVGAAYLALNASYSLKVKDVVILDVLFIALGFVLRVVAGCLAVPVAVSPWILVCTLLLALFLGLCKRRHELLLVGDGQGDTRKVLPHYSPLLLDQMIAQTGAAVLVAYMLYTFQPYGAQPTADPYMMLTVPFVIYGIWRYQYLAYRKHAGGSPEVAFRDRSFVANAVLWVVVVVTLACGR